MKIRELDNKDVVFLDEVWTEEELKSFRALLKKKQERKDNNKLNIVASAKVVTGKKSFAA